MAKKVFIMSIKEVGDAFEERVANDLKGRLQIGSGRIKTPQLRADVLANPFLIECKATKESHITIKKDIWEDVVKKAKETPYVPAYAVSVVDQWGNYYDFLGIEHKNIPTKLLKKMCTQGMSQSFEVNKTKKVASLIDVYKQRQYVEIDFGDDRLWFIPLNRLKTEFKELTQSM